MNYIKKTLLQDEQIIYDTRPHWIIFFPAAILVTFLLFFLLFGDAFLPDFAIFGYSIPAFIDLALFVAVVYQVIVTYIRYATSEYGVTNQRIIIKVGFVSRATWEVLLKRVESIQVDQTVMGRVLNYGTVVIRGTGGSRDAFNYIPNPLEFRKIAQQEIAQSQKL